jgi:hypothetical protein
VAGNTNTASTNAEQFVKTLKSSDALNRVFSNLFGRCVKEIFKFTMFMCSICYFSSPISLEFPGNTSDKSGLQQCHNVLQSFEEFGVSE